MKWEQIIMGILAVIWGVVLFFMRPEILQLSREGGRGLRDRRVINALVIMAIIFLILGGLIIIIVRGF
jgi:uncharacterized membrane protein